LSKKENIKNDKDKMNMEERVKLSVESGVEEEENKEENKKEKHREEDVKEFFVKNLPYPPPQQKKPFLWCKIMKTPQIYGKKLSDISSQHKSLWSLMITTYHISLKKKNQVTF